MNDRKMSDIPLLWGAVTHDGVYPADTRAPVAKFSFCEQKNAKW
jgi:hypothetical protein